MTSRLERRRVFVDTAAFFALSHALDANHGAATLIQRRLVREHWQMVTTNFIVAETHALALSRVGRTEALRLLDRIDSAGATGGLNVVRIESTDEILARDIIRRYGDKEFSLTDATSFAVMQRLNMRIAFTFDNDFAQYGLDVLTPRT